MPATSAAPGPSPPSRLKVPDSTCKPTPDFTPATFTVPESNDGPPATNPLAQPEIAAAIKNREILRQVVHRSIVTFVGSTADVEDLSITKASPGPRRGAWSSSACCAPCRFVPARGRPPAKAYSRQH